MQFVTRKQLDELFAQTKSDVNSLKLDIFTYEPQNIEYNIEYHNIDEAMLAVRNTIRENIKFEIHDYEARISSDIKNKKQESKISNSESKVSNSPNDQEQEEELKDELVDLPPEEELYKDIENNFVRKPSETIVNTFVKQNSLFGQSMIQSRLTMSNSKEKKIKIYLFGTPQFINVPVKDLDNVKDLINNVLKFTDQFNDPSFFKSQNPDAYELRSLEDDDDYVPDMSFQAIDKSRIVVKMNLDAFALLHNPSFKFDQNEERKYSLSYNHIKKLEPNKDSIILTVEVFDDDDRTLKMKIFVNLNQNATIRDLFQHIIKKHDKKITAKSYVAKQKSIHGDEFIELDLTTFVKNLAHENVSIFKKNWADLPNPTKQERITYSEVHNEEIPMNQIQAFKYEEFQVIKINNLGKRQPRILAIDQKKVYTFNREAGLLQRIFYDKNSHTRNPEKQISSLIEFKIESDNTPTTSIIKLYFRGSNENKICVYEAESQMAKKIISKLEFITKKN